MEANRWRQLIRWYELGESRQIIQAILEQPPLQRDYDTVSLLARALCATRTMLLLDEPVAGLDPMVTREMYQTIDMLHREKSLTVVMISHDLDAALRQGDRILHLSHDGIFLGTPEEYRHSPLGQRFVGGCSHD